MIDATIIELLSATLDKPNKIVTNTLNLMNDGATIPFISRYRKEVTNSMDEVQLGELKQQYEKLMELSKRKTTILSTIKEQNQLTDELKKRIEQCWNSVELEDIYLPYKPKRRTKAEIARQKGLEPLAKIIMKQQDNDVEKRAEQFLSKDVTTADDALQGAMDIIAEWINENGVARNNIRRIFRNEAVISSKLIKTKADDEKAQHYRDYFARSEKLSRISSHRLLAMRRGETEGYLRVSIDADEEKCLNQLNHLFVRTNTESSNFVTLATKDAFKRLLKPSIETEFATASKEKADVEAIKVFAENLKQLLLAPPLGQKRIMGVDPGFRTGCKVVCLDAQGNLVHNENIYPHPPQNEYAQAKRKVQKMVEAYDIQAIAVGNGTAGRETEQFFQSIRFDRKVQLFVVNESGASIYSASKIAREEFPNFDVTVRGAVSIGRRLIDPLAELVKIDPKSIGVGQYQHDVEQNLLKKSLEQTVENTVNRVGVDVNTASKHLLTYISGLGPQLAQNMVDYRTEKGAFTNRKQFLNVSKLGQKTFEQCAGFLRIVNGENPLDNSAVHPENYKLVEQISADINIPIQEMVGKSNLKKEVNLARYVTNEVGLPTLNDIFDELEKPGRDPRATIQVFEFDKNIRTINDLQEGMELPGIITNVTNFGAFCDVGIKENGLIHISNLADRFVSNPADVVSLHQYVTVRVLEVDVQRKRIQLKLIE